jgi:diaminohydroxyphosphoribosylaminopyrimidine deaminase/5-amino-6-(5-phosphoribosylamino)uracil reductase
MRHEADAVLTGIGTVLADDPALTDRSGVVGPGGRARRRALLRVVLDSALGIPLDSQLVRSANGDVLVICGIEASQQRAAALEVEGVQVERVGCELGQPQRLNLASILDLLGARKILSVLLECGSELNGSFLKQRLVDKLVLFHSRSELGEAAVPFAARFLRPAELESSMGRVTQTRFGADTRVCGYLRDPWDGLG